jgi:hypothetical protein
MTDLDSLSALAWLVDAGADEAVGDEPVNRLVAKPAPKPTDFLQPPPGHRPPPAAQRSAFTPARPAPTLAQQARASAPVIEGDEIGTAMDIAARANTLPELKAALEAYDGCSLKKLATNTVFADGVPGAAFCVSAKRRAAMKIRLVCLSWAARESCSTRCSRPSGWTARRTSTSSTCCPGGRRTTAIRIRWKSPNAFRSCAAISNWRIRT